MRIAMIAMSGVRVQNAELMAAGLTLPGFVERSEVIASLPSLSLLTLAGMTPPDVEVTYHEIADLDKDAPPEGEIDLVALTTMTAQAPEAYRVAGRLRAAGVPVVMGGLHATACPEEALRHCDAVVVGEGECVWAPVVEDARRGRVSGIYKAQGEFDFAEAPMPRFDLLDPAKYNRLTVQTTRGCPHKCEFCASSITLTRGYKVKPIEKVIAEVRAIKSIWPRPFIELADDNSFAQRGPAKALLRELARERVKWFTEADISIAKDPELLELMRRAGCRQVLCGLESPVPDGLAGVETNADWKLRQFPANEQAVRTIQGAGITVIGCFVLGLDGQGPAVFDEVLGFARRTSLYDVQVTVQTPFPGTPLYARLERAGRLTHPGRWERCTLFDVNYEPVGMSVAELESGLKGLVQRLYHPDFVRERREGYFRMHRGAALN
ncbi:MAG: radical SAM protein [Phycisphaerales bacterium]